MFVSTVKFENNVMFTAWNIAKESFNYFKRGSVKQYFKESLKLAWKLFKELSTPTLDEDTNTDCDKMVLKYMSDKLITMYEKNVFFERMESVKLFKGKEVKRKDLFFNKVKEGFRLENITLMAVGGKFINKEGLILDKDQIFGLDELDKKYIAFLIRKERSKK